MSVLCSSLVLRGEHSEYENAMFNNELLHNVEMSGEQGPQLRLSRDETSGDGSLEWVSVNVLVKII